MNLLKSLEGISGRQRFGIHLSHMRKSPGMYFGSEPFLRKFRDVVTGISVAESVHEVENSLFPDYTSFYEWLVSTKGYESCCLGWPGIIEQLSDDSVEQLELAIDLMAEFLSLDLLPPESI